LDATPFAGKRIGLILVELPQGKTADTIGAFPEHSFRACRTDSLNGSFIFGSEASLQVHASATACKRPGGKSEQQHNDNDPDEHEGF
jgi:hypothetical protein